MRRESGLSQEELAYRIDSRQSAISLLENAGANPTLRHVEELFSTMGYEPVLTFKKRSKSMAGEQTNAFADDKLDPYVAKVADRVIDLIVQKAEADDKLKVEKKNLIGLLKKFKKVQIQHRGMILNLKTVAEKDELTIKQLKPVDRKKSKAKRIK